MCHKFRGGGGGPSGPLWPCGYAIGQFSGTSSLSGLIAEDAGNISDLLLDYNTKKQQKLTL